MFSTFDFLLVVQFLSIFVLLFEACFIFVKWRTRLQGILFISCVATLVNNAGYLMAMTAGDAKGYITGIQVTYIGKVWVPFSLFLFCLKLCNVHINRAVIHTLVMIHIFTFGLVLTCRYNNLYYSSFTFIQNGLFPHVKFGHGPWHIGYTILVVFYVIVGVSVLIWHLVKEKDKDVKKRMTTIAFSIVAESLFYILQLAGVGGDYDMTSMGYAISAVIMCVGLTRYDILETLEVARDVVIDEIPEGVIVLNKQNELEYANAKAQDMFDLEGQLDKVKALLDDTVEKKEPLSSGSKMLSIERKKLSYQGSERGLVYVLEDDTNLYEYMNALKEQKGIAEEALASKSSFISVVSHEIRTPMNAIVGMTELLLRDKDKLTEQQYKYLDNIKHSGQSLVMIVNDILDQSKIEAGKMEIVNDNYEIRPILEDVCLIIENRVGDKQIEIKTEIDENIPRYLFGDGLRIRQVLINLMNNAVKFTESGYVKLLVEKTDSQQDRVKVRFTVEDSGQGIKEEDLAKLGEAFAQVDTRKNHSKEGTGLGLSISRDFISMMGGKMEIESQYGKGSKFKFSIWQNVPDQDVAERVLNVAKDGYILSGPSDENKISMTADGEIECKDVRVLVVDDNAVNQLIISEMLKPYDISIDTADCGEKCLGLIETNKYDMIFMDYMMPGINGVTTTKKIRESGQNIPVISMSGDDSEETVKAFKQAGITDFISKPIELDKLKKILVKWV